MEFSKWNLKAAWDSRPGWVHVAFASYDVVENIWQNEVNNSKSKTTHMLQQVQLAGESFLLEMNLILLNLWNKNTNLKPKIDTKPAGV